MSDDKKKINYGGQAFPSARERSVDGEIVKWEEGGMNLREYFAIHAPDGLADDAFDTVEQCANFLGVATKDYDYKIHWPLIEVAFRVRWADALIAELNKPAK